MSIVIKTLILVIATTLFGGIYSSDASGHSGRTDSNGGHNCRVGACAGTYHYHNGGSSYTPPPTPNYYEQGFTNGKAHAEKEADIIRAKSKQSGYQSGYSIGQSGAQQVGYETHPDTICDTSFTFDAGTNEVYKSAYDLGWHNLCNTYAREVYQTSRDEGYKAGFLAKPAVLSSSDSRDEPNNDWYTWGVLGLFVGVPVVGAIAGGIKNWWDEIS